MTVRNSLVRLAASRRGTSAVEFALLAPVFILMMLGMIAYGIYFGASHALQQIAADAARTAVAGLDEAERRELAAAFVERNAAHYAFIDPARLSLELADSPVDPNQFVVAVSYDASQLPIWDLMPELFMPGATISRSSTIRLGGR